MFVVSGVKNVLDGLVGHTDLRIILFSDSNNFDSYESERVQIVRIRMNYGYLIRTLNAIFLSRIGMRSVLCMKTPSALRSILLSWLWTG